MRRRTQERPVQESEMSEKRAIQTVKDLPQEEAEELSAEQAAEAGGGWSFSEIPAATAGGSGQCPADPSLGALMGPHRPG
jgi:hypothetical protein